MSEAARLLAALRPQTPEDLDQDHAAMLRAMLGVRAARRRSRRAPTPRYPMEVERGYTRALEAYAARVSGEVWEVLRGPLARAARAEAAENKTRGDAFPLSEILAVLGALRLRLTRPTSAAAKIVDQHGDRIVKASAEDAARVLQINLEENPAAVRALMAEWRRENVNLISSIPANLLDPVLEIVSAAADRGTRVETVAKEIQNRFGVTKSRARLIARDQIAKANGQLTEIRHREAGVTRYRWSTSGDERVRPKHKALNRTEHSWDYPPVVNSKGERRHPGGDIQCRCVAVPILDLD